VDNVTHTSVTCTRFEVIAKQIGASLTQMASVLEEGVVLQLDSLGEYTVHMMEEVEYLVSELTDAFDEEDETTELKQQLASKDDELTATKQDLAAETAEKNRLQVLVADLEKKIVALEADANPLSSMKKAQLVQLTKDEGMDHLTTGNALTADLIIDYRARQAILAEQGSEEGLKAVEAQLLAAHSTVARLKVACEAFGIPASKAGKSKTKGQLLAGLAFFAYSEQLKEAEA